MCDTMAYSTQISCIEEVPMVQVSSLRDAFVESDWNLLADVIIDMHVLGLDRLSEFGAKRVDAVRERIHQSLSQMCDVGVCGHWGRRRILVPRETFQLDRSTFAIRRHIDACCVCLQDLEDGTFLYDDPQIDFGFYDLPWYESLSIPVWYLSTFCQQERYMMLASAFWEITRNGFSQDRRGELSHDVPRTVDPSNGIMASLSNPLTARRPAGFDWGYRQRMRSRVIELNRCAEENFFQSLESLGKWCRRSKVMEDRF